MTPQTVTAEPLVWTDVKGKQLYYIKLQNENGEMHMINVGEKTYNTCKDLQNQVITTGTPETKGATKK